MKNEKAIGLAEILNGTLDIVKKHFTNGSTRTLSELTHNEFDEMRAKLKSNFHAWVVYSNLHQMPGMKPADLEPEIVIDVSASILSYKTSERMTAYLKGEIPETTLMMDYPVEKLRWRTEPYRHINFALDYDDTASEDLELWVYFCKMARSRGHNVYIVTMRYPSECYDIPKVLADNTCGVYPTSRMAKNPFMLAQGIVIHNWIDDNPRAIYMNAGQAFGRVAQEGDVQSAAVVSAAG